jgi:acetyl-CoA C-acetyltransferase
MIQKVYLIGGSRTPVGCFMGSLKEFSGIELAIASTKHTIKQTGIDPKLIDQVILGNVIGTGTRQNPCRQVSLGSSLNPGAPCVNVNKLCASGLKSVILGTQSLRLGHGKLALVGGFESMSNIPFLLKNYRKGHKFGNLKILDALTYDGLTDFQSKKAMGFCAEHTARELGITKDEQDKYCIESYQRALRAQERGVFAKQICTLTTRKGKLVHLDEEPMRYNPEKMMKLKPVFVDK